MLEALNLLMTDCVIVAVFFVMLVFIISKLSKLTDAVENLSEKKSDTVTEDVAAAVTVAPPVASPAVTAVPVAASGIELYKTDEKSAATIMAIVSHETGIPFNRLAFKSIKLVDDLDLYKTDDKTAATIMAIVSHQSGIPLDRLVFRSIKLIEK